jgi:hypothetical protein
MSEKRTVQLDKPRREDSAAAKIAAITRLFRPFKENGDAPQKNAAEDLERLLAEDELREDGVELLEDSFKGLFRFLAAHSRRLPADKLSVFLSGEGQATLQHTGNGGVLYVRFVSADRACYHIYGAGNALNLEGEAEFDGLLRLIADNVPLIT